MTMKAHIMVEDDMILKLVKLIPGVNEMHQLQSWHSVEQDRTKCCSWVQVLPVMGKRSAPNLLSVEVRKDEPGREIHSRVSIRRRKKCQKDRNFYLG